MAGHGSNNNSDGVPRFLAAALAYLALTIAHTWPLASQLSTVIASDPFDPALNTTNLWWNAVTIPFSAAWWERLTFLPGRAPVARG